MAKNTSPRPEGSSPVWMWIILSFFGLVAMGQFERIELRSFPAFYLHDVIIALFVVWQSTNALWRKAVIQVCKRFPTLGWVSLGWAGTGMALATFSGSSIIYPLSVFLRIAVYTLAALGVFISIRKRQITSPLLRSGVIFFFSALLFFGILQYVFVPDTRFLFFLGWDDHYYRMISTLFDPGFTGILFALGYLFLQEQMEDGKHLRPLSLLLSLCLMVGLLLTYSRASYLAFGAIIFFLTWQKWRTGQLRQAAAQAFLLVVFVFCLFFLPQPGGEGVKLGRTSTITARAITAQNSLSLFTTPQAMVLGNGLFVPPVQTPSQYTGTTSHAKTQDNWLLALLTGTGFVGTVLGFALLFITIRWTFRFQHSYLWIAVMAVLVHGMFNATVTFPFVWIVLLSWGVLAKAEG